MHRLAAYAAAIAIAGSSFALYASQFDARHRWQAELADPADYRLIGEYFWGAPILPDSYRARPGWDSYLETFPFRAIGRGTVYLAVGVGVLGHAPRSLDEIERAGLATAAVEKVALAAAMLVLFAVMRRHWGTAQALVALIVLSFPPRQWRITDDFLTEPLARVCFLLVVASAIAAGARARRSQWQLLAIAGLFVVVTQIKSDWLLAEALVFPLLLFELPRDAAFKRWASAIVLILMLAPAALLTVNWIGWHRLELRPGVGLHINRKYNGRVRTLFCDDAKQQGATFVICDGQRRLDRWWLMTFGPEVDPAEYLAFDRFAERFVLTNPQEMLDEFIEGLGLGSVMPGREVIEGKLIRAEALNEPWDTIVELIDAATWVLLFFGLMLSETRLLSGIALVLWIVPAAGNVFSVYEYRYHLPMAGFGAAAGCRVAMLLAALRWPAARRASSRLNLRTEI